MGKRLFLVLALLLASMVPSFSGADSVRKLKVLIVTGGHGFEKEPFFALFQENPEINFTAVKLISGFSWNRAKNGSFSKPCPPVTINTLSFRTLSAPENDGTIEASSSARTRNNLLPINAVVGTTLRNRGEDR